MQKQQEEKEIDDAMTVLSLQPHEQPANGNHQGIGRAISHLSRQHTVHYAQFQKQKESEGWASVGIREVDNHQVEVMVKKNSALVDAGWNTGGRDLQSLHPKCRNSQYVTVSAADWNSMRKSGLNTNINGKNSAGEFSDTMCWAKPRFGCESFGYDEYGEPVWLGFCTWNGDIAFCTDRNKHTAEKRCGWALFILAVEGRYSALERKKLY